jgi:hypothetical protein
VPASVAGLYDECSRSWFESDGPLTPGALRRGFVGGAASGAPSQDIGPPGDGLFQCLYPIPSAGGAAADPAAVNGFDASMRTLMAVREIPGDMRQGLFDQWSSSSASLRSRGGGGDWEPAIAKIKVTSSPAEWSLQEIPEKIRGDGSLRTIWNQVREGMAKGGGGSSVAAAARGFSVDGYVTELDAIANALGQALEDPSGFGLIELYSDAARASAGRSPFERAINAVRNAPTPAFKKELEMVPRTIWKKIVDSAQSQLEGYYAKRVRTPILSLMECYPFAEKGPDCKADDFEALFGPKGGIGKLAAFGEDAAAGTDSRFGASLKVGDRFQAFVRSALPIHRAYAEGAAGDQGGFRLTFDTQVGEPQPVGKVDRKELIFDVENAILSFGAATKIAYSGAEGASTQKISIPIDDAAKSRLTLTLGERRAATLGEKFGRNPFGPSNTEVGEAPTATGPWSFLRLMSKTATEKGCCVFDVPVFEKNKKGEKGDQVAHVNVAFNLVPPRSGRTVLDRGFWGVEAPPDSVKE